MLFNVALFGGLLLAPVAAAVPASSGASVARPNTARAAGNTVYTSIWAGALLSEDNGTFSNVTGTVTLPIFSGPDGSSTSFWLGIDGFNCTNSSFHAGVLANVQGGSVTYTAWFHWLPAAAYSFPNITVSGGHTIKLTVAALSANSGFATIEDLTNGQTATESIDSSGPLCGHDAAWIVESNSPAPFPDFGTITFTDAKAMGAKTYTPNEATIVDMYQNGTFLANVALINDTSVVIQHQASWYYFGTS